MMKSGALIKVFWRSFFIHVTLNYRRMQNLGFTYAIIPFLGERNVSDQDTRDFLNRHLQMFNTHPYLSASLIGSIIRMEEDRPVGQDATSVEMVKQSLMGPYAAIGDTFFWGALRPCAGIVGAGVACLGGILAPIAFLLVYTPAHLWVRLMGFVEGYRRGKQGIEFIRRIDLPRVATRVRWLSLLVLAGFSAGLLQVDEPALKGISHLLTASISLAVILACWFLIKKGVSQIYILYGAVILFLIIVSRDSLTWWK